MKKKTITCALGTMMITAAAFLPVYAADSPNMEVKYTQETTYILSIPSDIDLSANSVSKAENIGLSAINAAPDKKVQVKIKSGISNSEVELSRTGETSTKVVSKVTDKENKSISDNFIVAEFEGTSDTPKPIVTGTGILNFSKIEDAIDANADVKAGEYTGTIVFEGAVVDKQP